MKIWLLPLAFVLTGCLVKPPPDNSDLGPPTTAAAINAAMLSAQSGVDPVKGFLLGDQGTVLIVDTVMGSSQVSQTAYYQIIAADATTYTVQETIGTQVAQGTFYRPGMAPSPSPSPSASPGGMGFYNLPNTQLTVVAQNPLSRFLDGIWSWAAKWLSKIQVQPSTAVGDQNFPQSLLPGQVSGFVSYPWTLVSENQIRGVQIEAVASPTPSPSPVPTPTPGTTITSDNYFGLQVSQNMVLTKNCAQIANCSVPATKIQFNEVITTSAGQTIRLLWAYQFSKIVPGLFTMIDRCWSQVITQNGIQTPLTHCDNHLDDFRWGSPP